MEYSTLKKLALSMGEEFKIIDNVTLEAINVQRLITKEKEYCSTLEALIKSSDAEIASLENETASTKSKLEDVINRGSLLKSSLESLKSSHHMVKLLKGDLLKQLQLELIQTSEQNIKFESTLKKYEGMWENYKVIYQKFPMVSDLKKMQAKLKLESIQLSMLEKEAKDHQNKISKFISIQDKKEKLLLINVAKKYIIREKLKRERDDLEKSIRFKRNDLEIEKLQGVRLQSYESSSSLLESDFKNDNQVSDTLSVLMDNFITELAKENISFVAEKSKSADVQHGNFLDYEATLNRGTSLPALKIPPLPIFDSPPRKLRSVGNLLSPPKEWTRECGYESDAKSLTSMEVASNNLPVCDTRDTNNDLDAKEPTDSKEMDMDYPGTDPSNSYTMPEVSENKSNIEEYQTEMVMEIDVSEEDETARNANPKFDEEEDYQRENEDVGAIVPDHTEYIHGNEKPVFPSDSTEFAYEPRTNRTAKVEEESVPETTSPYFVASSYLNFMDIPKIVKNVKNDTITMQKDKKINEGKGNIPVIDLIDNDITKENEDQHESSMNETDSNIIKECPMMHLLEVKSASLTSNELGMEISHEDITQNNDTSHDENATNKEQLPSHDGSITVKKSECNPTYKEQIICENIAQVSPQPSEGHGDLNMSYGSPMNYSQVSYSDSIDYQDNYQSFSPGASSIDGSPQFIPESHGHANIFGSCAEKSAFSYGFSSTPQQSSASSLFGSTNSENNESKERKQNEVFNFSFDTKSKTPTMFKLF